MPIEQISNIIIKFPKIKKLHLLRENKHLLKLQFSK